MTTTQHTPELFPAELMPFNLVGESKARILGLSHATQ